MFDQVMGLPAHVLMVHAAVVFVPLLAAAAAVYALVPRLRPRVGWVAALLAVAAPAATLAAVLSGQKFRDRQVSGGAGAQLLEAINAHEHYGNLTLYFSLGLGASTALLVFFTQRGSRARSMPVWVDVVLAMASVALAAATAYYVFRTGDSGAKAVWGS